MKRKISIVLSRDVAAKAEKATAQKIFEKNVDWCKQPALIRVVPNQPDINNRVLSVRISREFYLRLQKEADARKMGFNEYVRWLIWKATESVNLTKQDYDQIEREKQQDSKRANAKRRFPKN